MIETTCVHCGSRLLTVGQRWFLNDPDPFEFICGICGGLTVEDPLEPLYNVSIDAPTKGTQVA